MAMHSLFERSIKSTSSCWDGVYILNKIIHVCLEICNFTSHERGIPYLHGPMHYYSIFIIIITGVPYRDFFTISQLRH